MRHCHPLAFITYVILLFVLSGCASGPGEPPKTLLALHITASPLLNPNTDGDPSPLVVRLYELKAETEFKTADFFTLFDQDRTILASDLAASRKELEFKPGERRILDLELSPETRFIGILAAYRDLDNAIWRALTPIATRQANSLAIRLGENELTIAPGVAKRVEAE
ncbi:MAG: type VI secretion system lipoprotein TssJ [Gammaproteobacteria bacterium]|nr:type VI secretion system lipoprotein TssJ [Gammaproteobacteria bacterium]